MPGTRIAAMGHHQPSRVLSNADLEQMVETSDDWIRQRTGIATRRIAGAGESVTDMAAAAAAKALAASGLAPAEIGLMTVATCSAVDRCPSIAAQVAARLGIPSAVCFDLNNGCAGFTTALASADHAFRAGAARHALVVGAEKMSDVTDWSDRSTCVLLADGAGAAVISSAEAAHEGIGCVVWGSDLTRGNAVRLQDSWQPKFAQEGQTVFRWATTELPAFAEEACRRAGIATTDLAALVTHQANLRIIEALTRRLALRDDVVIARDVVDSGNTSAASVPLAVQTRRARRGTSWRPRAAVQLRRRLSWASQVVACP
ncbi:beta-ketoacyl-ACP synthase 3 [Streptomyces brevispora]|uniref:Beta-ketoacyl-ACP synthase 3 n=1 Tax=Streptomyces brevispora TaxID=887462 RepID=A0ABZ1FZZ1_9ACTN|nr:beta-ketoacyl-ACP synthase 3 [Streptomyces brevispora]WSC13193.1 beta-ketoacyl-ACP synthase 3 [Streptomyces brevispora]